MWCVSERPQICLHALVTHDSTSIYARCVVKYLFSNMTARIDRKVLQVLNRLCAAFVYLLLGRVTFLVCDKCAFLCMEFLEIKFKFFTIIS